MNTQGHVGDDAKFKGRRRDYKTFQGYVENFLNFLDCCTHITRKYILLVTSWVEFEFLGSLLSILLAEKCLENHCSQNAYFV